MLLFRFLICLSKQGLKNPPSFFLGRLHDVQPPLRTRFQFYRFFVFFFLRFLHQFFTRPNKMYVNMVQIGECDPTNLHLGFWGSKLISLLQIDRLAPNLSQSLQISLQPISLLPMHPFETTKQPP